MASKDIVAVKTEKEFLQFLDNIDDLEYLENNKFNFKDISISIKLEGDNFDSSLTGNIITGLAEYQKRIHHIYRTSKYGLKSKKRLTPEEEKLLEIKVIIKPGCTDVVVALINKLPEVFSNMTGDQQLFAVIGAAGIVAGAWVIKGIASSYIIEKFKTKRKDISAKKAAAKDEKDKKMFEVLESVAKDILEGMSSFCEGISSTKVDKVSIEGKEVPLSRIASIPSEVKPQKPHVDKEERFYTVEGFFRVLELNYEKDTTRMKAEYIKTSEVYENISLQNDWLTAKSMKALKNAEQREPLYFKLIVNEKAGKKSMGIDVNSIDPSKKVK